MSVCSCSPSPPPSPPPSTASPSFASSSRVSTPSPPAFAPTSPPSSPPRASAARSSARSHPLARRCSVAARSAAPRSRSCSMASPRRGKRGSARSTCARGTTFTRRPARLLHHRRVPRARRPLRPVPGGWVAAEFPQLAPTVLTLVEEGAVPPLMRAAAGGLLLRDAVAPAHRRPPPRRRAPARALPAVRGRRARDVNAARCARPACAAARQLDELSADALRRRRAAAPLSLVSRYRRSQRKAPRNYRRIAALVAPCTFAHFADQMAGTDES